MQSDVWYELALRDLSGTDHAMLELVREAEAAQGAPEDPDTDAEEESATT